MPESSLWSFSLCEMRELDECKSQLAAYLHQSGAPDETIEDAKLVAEELINNVLQYGECPQAPQVEVLCELTPAIRLTITDNCTAFNPLEEIPPANLSADDEERADGGFGFLIVQKIAANLKYNRRNHRNVLQITLPSIPTETSCH
ncbi:ATP-binding protein [Cerasicoccus fimbriatus]|uniref:ATP-binding protein n=1 Tax=Cerasicoccus fimbriatus TaxID=3014554 RepID=UPI0022B4E4E9|nr:ATP-binding protein [Cerasicoccus sp. TK19100]